jgi:hypothetical protein
VPHKVDVGWTIWPCRKYPQRFDYFKRCWKALDEHLHGEGVEVRHVVSAEFMDVEEGIRKELARFCTKHGLTLTWHKGKPSLPGNLDHLLDACDAPYFFYMQDDWEANRPIDLLHGIKLLQANPDVNVLRYRWVGNPDVNHADGDLDSLFRRIKTSAEWYFAHNPYLANRSAMEKLRPIGARESKVNGTAKKKKFGVAVRIPSIFKHIGGQSVMTPWKERPVDKVTVGDFNMVTRDAEWFLSKFRDGTPVTFSRWGDGEWRAAINRVRGKNCDGHPFSPNLLRELQAVLQDKPQYTMGMQPLAVKLYGEPILKFIKDNGLEYVEWSDGDVLHKVAIKKQLGTVIDALRGRRIIMVGSKHLLKLRNGTSFDLPFDFINVGGTSVFDRRQKIMDEVSAALDKATESCIVSFCSGMTTEIMLHKLYPVYGTKHSLVDFGSLWDPLAGVKSRTYMRQKNAPNYE